MISIYQLKPRFQNLLRPLVQRLYDNGTTANQITVLAGIVSLLVGLLIAGFAQHAWVFVLIPLWMILRMALNAIDGMLAREFGQQSRLGAYLNELCDVIADSALILPFALLPGVSLAPVLLVTLLAVFSEYAGVLGPMVGASRRYDGPMGKSDRAFVLGVLATGVALGWLGAGWVDGVMWLVAALLAYTLVNRQQHTFSTHDGVELFYRHWPATSATGPEPRQAILLFHRGHEHSGRIAHLVDELDLPQFDFFAWDARGHGQSPGERGDSPSFATSARDVQTFCDHIGATYGIAPENLAVIAQSVGAVIAATWVHDYAPSIRALVLASPAFKVKLYVPFARSGLALMRRFRGNFFVNSYVKAKFLSHDPERVASYDTDPLITKAISVNVLLGLYEAADRVVADAQAIQVPTQLLISGSDFVVHRKPQQQFFERLGSLKKELHILPGFFHDTLGERDRAVALASARRFILQNFAHPLDRASLLDADKIGATCAESESLAAPLPHNSLRDLYWRMTRASMGLGRKLSEGVKLGFDTGFDSGSTLDY
eukprot:gene14436-14231_t